MRLYAALIVALVVCVTARGAAPPPAKSANTSSTPDIEFLEYLGTLESDEENWTDVMETQQKRATPKPNPSTDTKGKPVQSSARKVESSNER